MKYSTTVARTMLASGIAVLLAGLGWWRGCSADRLQPATVRVVRGPLAVWTMCDGYLESRHMVQVMSQLPGAATVVEVVSDGTPVQAGDVVVRFDAAQLERELFRLERDAALAREDLASLENAKLPMELKDIEMRCVDARAKQADEEQALLDNRELAGEALISQQEIQQQEVRVESARVVAASLEQQLDLTRRFVHPSALERSRATLRSAAQELALAMRQMSNCTVLATSSGVVGYKPLLVAGEFRSVRVGDTVFKNQPFMTVSDMSNLVVYCEVAEAELSRFQPGSVATVRPVACPDLSLDGVVETVGNTARIVSGRPAGQRYFDVVIRLNSNEPRLRSGMSVEARVLVYERRETLRVPRIAVGWERDASYCVVRRPAGSERRKVLLGLADETAYEVIEGLAEGDTLLLR